MKRPSRAKAVDPRANQKARTRAALVEAAAGLLRRGAAPTVADAADEARVSRATAYRYFQTQEALLLEVSDVSPAMAPVEALLADLPSDDVEERLTRLVDLLGRLVLEHEVGMRTALRVYLDTWIEARRAGRSASVAVREGRRLRWLDRVLEPVQRGLSPAQRQRLRSALALTVGIDAVVVLRDVCRLDDDEELLGVLRWATLTLARAALAEGAPRAVSASRRGRARPAGESRARPGSA